MVNGSLEKLKKELDSIDQSEKLTIIEYLIQGIKNDTRMRGVKYQFGDLAGKLKWVGDPVSEQRKIRDEW